MTWLTVFLTGIFFRRYVRRTVVVHLKSGSSLRGILYDVHFTAIVLRHAGAAPQQARDFVDVDGEQLIDRSNIDWIQVPESEELK